MSARAVVATADIRGLIVEAARVRFERYGFNKSTMAEIAGDCGMSAANLYRYFESKSEIAAHGTQEWLAEFEAELAEIAAEPDVAPEETLRRLIHARLKRIADLSERHPHLDELTDSLFGDRPELLADHVQAVVQLIGEVIGDGIERGRFRAGDPQQLAMTFFVATRGLTHHAIVHRVPRAELERSVDDVVALLVDGLARR